METQIIQCYDLDNTYRPLILNPRYSPNKTTIPKDLVAFIFTNPSMASGISENQHYIAYLLLEWL